MEKHSLRIFLDEAFETSGTRASTWSRLCSIELQPTRRRANEIVLVIVIEMARSSTSRSSCTANPEMMEGMLLDACTSQLRKNHLGPVSPRLARKACCNCSAIISGEMRTIGTARSSRNAWGACE